MLFTMRLETCWLESQTRLSCISWTACMWMYSAIKLLVLDGNLSTDAFTSLVSTVSMRGVLLFFEPTSSYKCLLPLLAGCFHQVRTVPHITTLTIASWSWVTTYACMPASRSTSSSRMYTS